MDYFIIGIMHLLLLSSYHCNKSIKTYRHRKFIEEDVAWQIASKEMGVPMNSIRFDENNSLIDPRTGKPVVYGSH